MWSNPKNQELAKLRKDPNVLLPGDILRMPRAERTGKPLEQGTTNRYSVDVPKVTTTLTFEDDRLFNARYVLEGCVPPLEGKADGQGRVTLQVPVHVREALLRFVERAQECALYFGDLDPVDEASGARSRLQHLGFLHPAAPTAPEAQLEADLRKAIAAFQQASGLPVTGVLDDMTWKKLEDEHLS